MTSDDRRERAEELFELLAVDLIGRPGVMRAKMFVSQGLKVNDKFFAFPGHDGRLIAKVPVVRVAALLASGAGEPVQMGKRTMREWVGVPLPSAPDGIEVWRELMADAYAFVASLTS